jgi:hypothetical protein
VVNQDAVCTYIQWKFAVVLTVLRSFNDLLYFVHICLQFRIAYVSLESMSAGRGELVVSKRLIALNYVTGPFVGDVVALMPLPQVGNFRFRKVRKLASAPSQSQLHRSARQASNIVIAGVKGPLH